MKMNARPTASHPATEHPQPIPLHCPGGSSDWERVATQTRKGITMLPAHTTWEPTCGQAPIARVLGPQRSHHHNAPQDRIDPSSMRLKLELLPMAAGNNVAP